MNFKQIAVDNYKRFCLLEGSDYIASEFALQTILQLVAKFKIKNILEVGLGIGSVSDTVIKFSSYNKININYFGTENNNFCLSVLPKYVENFQKIFLFKELSFVQNTKFELIIIDGSDKILSNIQNFCSKNAIIFVEGGRSEQTKIILEIFPKCLYVNVITLKKNPVYAHEARSVNSYIGGGQLVFTNPNLKMRIYWMKEKVATFIKIKLRHVFKNRN